MIVAGSVLALLLMGLAVDGFVNPADEEPDEADHDMGGDDDLSDQSGGGNGLNDLLFSGDDADEEDTDPLSYTPLDAIEPAAGGLSFDDVPADDVPEEMNADGLWSATEASTEYVDIEATTETEGGEDVAYVDGFDTDTDTLVLEFDGSIEDMPDIDVEYDAEEDAALIMANGIPVTMVEGAESMTAEHVRIIMGGEVTEGVDEPQVIPNSEGMDALEKVQDTTGPLTLSLPTDIDPAETLEGPQTLPTVDISAEAEVDVNAVEKVAETGPTTLPTAEGEVDAIEKTAESGPSTLPTVGLADPLAESLLKESDPGSTGPQTQIGNLDPLLPEIDLEPLEDVIDVVDTTVDLLPDDTIINALLDQVTDDLTDVGGLNEMLNARADIDDAFGTGGEDAQTGTFNADMIEGGDGQDALFGDEGNDTLMAGAGNDELYGDFGNDDLQGEEGVDFLDGGEGNDTLDGGGDRDLLFGGEGDDVLYGGAANDFLQGGMGADTLDGGSGDDTLDGLFGDGNSDADDGDALWGGDGDDHIILGQGDTAHGGAGADTFISGSYVENAEVAGHVADFNPGEDRIEVIFDPQENPDPTLEVMDFADGSGADILLNGEVILSVAGAQGLDPNMIELQAMA